MKPKPQATQTAHDWEELQSHLPQVDKAIRDMELKWGIGRIENLISPTTLLSWRRGNVKWREAIATGDKYTVREHAPKMLTAIRYMQAEAERLGHKPLEPHVWEAADKDGHIYAFTRTQAEANAIAADNREKEVWSLDEVVRILSRYKQISEIKRAFPGAKVERVIARDESFAGDFAKEPYLVDVLHKEKGWDVT